jgi:hypothetical protein
MMAIAYGSFSGDTPVTGVRSTETISASFALQPGLGGLDIHRMRERDTGDVWVSPAAETNLIVHRGLACPHRTDDSFAGQARRRDETG